jgi:hypothetical protein
MARVTQFSLYGFFQQTTSSETQIQWFYITYVFVIDIAKIIDKID